MEGFLTFNLQLLICKEIFNKIIINDQLIWIRIRIQFSVDRYIHGDRLPDDDPTGLQHVAMHIIKEC
jgi:hypothetical protein